MSLVFISVSAQKTVKGTVTDTQGEPLVGVQITQSCCNIGAVTDINGKYSIKVCNDNCVLTFHYLGMESFRASVKGKMPLNIEMRYQIQELNEAVVVSTGYQKLSRERSTAAFALVDSTKLTAMMHRSLASSLEGQVAGLRMNINPNTGDGSPILRGVGTFSNAIGTQPLVVIDDMVTEMSINDINPYDVESITVLKDAAASSIYGALAANGVIVVTTKQAKSSKVKVSVNGDWFISGKPNFNAMHYASSSDIIDYETDVYNARVAMSGGYQGLFSSIGNNYYSPLYQLYRDKADGKISESEANATIAKWKQNDYYEQYRNNAWRTSLTQRYNISLSQKQGESNHYASFSYENDRRQVIGDSKDAFNMYYKSNFNVAKWLNIKVGIDAKFNVGVSPNSSYTNYALQERYAQILDPSGKRVNTPYVNLGGYVGSAINGNVLAEMEGQPVLRPFSFNVLDALNESQTRSRNVRMRPFVNVEIPFLKMFKYLGMFQYEWSQNRSQNYDAPNTYQMRMTHNAFVNTKGESTLPDGGRYYQQTNNAERYTLRNQLNFDRAWKDNAHVVTAIMGLELRQNHTPRMLEQLMYGYNDVALTSARMDWASLYTDGWESLVYDQTLRYQGLRTTQTDVTHRYASFYANAGYNLFGKYNLTGSIRWDEADLFGLDAKEQHHPLWSVGGGWNITEESWMKPISWVDYLKLRATYGVNGNVDQTSSTYFVARYRTLSTDPTATKYLYYTDDNLPNPKLRWERTSTFNVGLDYRLLNNVLNGSIEFYNRTGSDLLVTKYLDSTLGATSRVINNGKMRNLGVELSLTGNIYRNRDWRVSTTLNIAYNKNKMLAVEHRSTDVSSNFISAPLNYFIEGTSYNTLWAYRLSRVVNGYPVILDADGNEMATFDADGNVTSVVNTSTLKGTDALVNCGTLTPVYNGSLSFNVHWKQLELNAMFIFSGGNKLRLDVLDMNAYNLNTSLINERWTQEDGEGKVRVFSDMPTDVQQYASTFSEWWKHSDAHIRPADYIKLRSINLAYSLDNKLCKRLGIGTTKFTLQVNNLFYLSAAGRNIDPESYSLNSGTRTLHQPKNVSLGLSVSF